MPVFYGVYIKDTYVSAILDLIRFLAEPDSLRFAHITLRGPYRQELTSVQLERLNGIIPGEWFISLIGPGNFFSISQCTVLLRIQLNDIDRIVKKPDFQNSVAHLTLYDGKDHNFASAMLEILYRYDLYRNVNVTKLRKIDKKAPISGNFIEFYPEFRNLFGSIVGPDISPDAVLRMSSTERLLLIQDVLDFAFPLHADKLNLTPPEQQQIVLDFEFPSEKKH